MQKEVRSGKFAKVCQITEYLSDCLMKAYGAQLKTVTELK